MPMTVLQGREVFERIRVAVVDDHTLFRDGVVATVNDTIDFEVVAEGQCGSEAVRIAQDHLPDIILLDANMPVGGIEAAREISKCRPTVKTVVLTSSDTPEHMIAASDAGARIYLTKGMSASELLATLRSVHFGSA